MEKKQVYSIYSNPLLLEMSILTARGNGKAIAQTHCFLGQPRQTANYETMEMFKKKKSLDIHSQS